MEKFKKINEAEAVINTDHQEFERFQAERTAMRRYKNLENKIESLQKDVEYLKKTIAEIQ